MHTSPTPPLGGSVTAPDPRRSQPIITPPPLLPEEMPVIVHDHGVDADEEHDIDLAAGDEGIDDNGGDDFDQNHAASRETEDEDEDEIEEDEADDDATSDEDNEEVVE